MRLTNSDRDAFVQAVLDDVPQINYDEQARSKVMAFAIARLPADLQPLYKKYPDFFETSWYRTPGCVSSVYAVGHTSCDIEAVDKDFWNELQELSNQKRAQSTTHSELRNQLHAAIFSCTTLKKAQEVLPEFKKYLPADRDGVVDRSMPIISNLLATLTEAGWPKDQPLSQGA
jgi:hypothetical protein